MTLFKPVPLVRIFRAAALVTARKTRPTAMTIATTSGAFPLFQTTRLVNSLNDDGQSGKLCIPMLKVSCD